MLCADIWELSLVLGVLYSVVLCCMAEPGESSPSSGNAASSCPCKEWGPALAVPQEEVRAGGGSEESLAFQESMRAMNFLLVVSLRVSDVLT